MRKKYRFVRGNHIEIKRYYYSREDTIQPGIYKVVSRSCQYFNGQMGMKGPVYVIAGPLPYWGKHSLSELELLPLLAPPVYKKGKVMPKKPGKGNEALYMETLVNQVIALYKNTPAGMIRDSDTVLSDLLLDADFEITGISLELLEIWLKSSDRLSIEALFLTFTGTEFQEYLQRCFHLTSR